MTKNINNIKPKKLKRKLTRKRTKKNFVKKKYNNKKTKKGGFFGIFKKK